MLKLSAGIILSLAVVGFANCANILFYAAIGTHSSRISKWPLMEALADRGHNVTYLSPFKNFELDPNKKSKINSYEPKIWSEFYGPFVKNRNFYEGRKNGSSNLQWIWMFNYGVKCCEMLYSDPEFVEWVKSNKFDLVVMETYVNECAFGLIHYWKAKWSMYSTSPSPPWHPDGYGLPDETSSIPEMLTGITNGHDMTFLERFRNALIPVAVHLLREYSYFPGLEEATRKGLGDDAKDLPPFREIEKNATLSFITQHYSIEFPRSYPPNVVPVGGNVISKKLKPLPKDMEKFVNESESGFMYVSFGTLADFTSFDHQVQVEFINALGKFPKIGFIWKSSNPLTATAIPKNVFVTKWAPQQAVLAHRRIKGYITHAGMGSATEAIHFSVPLVCLPVLSDQDGNADMIVRNGAGVKVEIIDMKQQALENAINEIIKNKKYKEGMARLTSIFKDRPIPTLENAVWWTEYVLRHDNVHEFLVHPSIHQSWWVRRQIDVWVTASLLLLTAILVPTYLLYFVAKKVLGISSGKSAAKKIKTN